MGHDSLIERVAQLFEPLIAVYGLTTTVVRDPHSHNAHVRLESAEFVVDIIRDRGQEWIEVGSRIHPGPRKPLRRWPLGHVVACLDGVPDPYGIDSLEAEAKWLIDRAGEILVSEVLNSEDLRCWAVRASRRMFGQKPRG